MFTLWSGWYVLALLHLGVLRFIIKMTKFNIKELIDDNRILSDNDNDSEGVEDGIIKG